MSDQTVVTNTGLTTEPPKLQWMQHVIGTFALLIVAAVFGWCLYDNPTQETRTMILTAVIGLMGGIVGYYFGSSAGSAQKTAIMSSNPPR